MKCKYCHGTGKIDGSVYPCDKCNGTGEIEQTNEEWFCQLPTEEKAEALTKVVLNIISFNNDPRPSEVRNTLKAWLKQPHNRKDDK